MSFRMFQQLKDFFLTFYRQRAKFLLEKDLLVARVAVDETKLYRAIERK